MKTAVFPGSFDPFTFGHLSVIQKASPLFDKIIIGIGQNSTKNALLSFESRKQSIEKLFESDDSIEVRAFEGLTVDFCKANEAGFILRGLRNPTDYQYESSIEQMNRKLANDILTVFINCDPEYAAINSRIVREIMRNGGDVSQFVPSQIDLSY